MTDLGRGAGWKSGLGMEAEGQGGGGDGGGFELVGVRVTGISWFGGDVDGVVLATWFGRRNSGVMARWGRVGVKKGDGGKLPVWTVIDCVNFGCGNRLHSVAVITFEISSIS